MNTSHRSPDIDLFLPLLPLCPVLSFKVAFDWIKDSLIGFILKIISAHGLFSSELATREIVAFIESFVPDDGSSSSSFASTVCSINFLSFSQSLHVFMPLHFCVDFCVGGRETSRRGLKLSYASLLPFPCLSPPPVTRLHASYSQTSSLSMTEGRKQHRKGMRSRVGKPEKEA